MAHPRKKTSLPRSHRDPGRRDRLQVDLVWTWHYRTLIALREQLVEERVNRLRYQDRPHFSGLSVAAAPAAPGPGHEFTPALLALEPAALDEISAAIERVLNGSYGICEVTGASIPAGRLRTTPWCRCAHDEPTTARQS